MKSKLDKNAKIIVACSAGGTMKPTQNLPEGQQSRWSNLYSPFLCQKKKTKEKTVLYIHASFRILMILYIYRSLIAAYLLVLNGYSNVFHLEGGLYNWFKEDLPAVAEDWSVGLKRKGAQIFCPQREYNE